MGSKSSALSYPFPGVSVQVRKVGNDSIRVSASISAILAAIDRLRESGIPIEVRRWQVERRGLYLPRFRCPEVNDPVLQPVLNILSDIHSNVLAWLEERFESSPLKVKDDDYRVALLYTLPPSWVVEVELAVGKPGEDSRLEHLFPREEVEAIVQEVQKALEEEEESTHAVRDRT